LVGWKTIGKKETERKEEEKVVWLKKKRRENRCGTIVFYLSL
jgi:hypothetical protein